MQAVCTCCRREHDLGARVAYKLVGTAIGLGGAAYFAKNPALAAVVVLATLGAGHLADIYVLPQCNACGGALRVLNDALTLLAMASPRRS